MTTSTTWMRPPWGDGDAKEVESAPEVLVPLMVAGWSQCEAPNLKPATPAPAKQQDTQREVHDVRG